MKTAERLRSIDLRAPKAPSRRVVLAAAALGAAALIALPARQMLAQRYEIGRLEQRLASLEQANKQLQQEADQLGDPANLELEARKLGLVRPGEKSYVFVPAPEAPAKAPAVEDEEPGWPSRAWSWLVRLVRGDG